MKKTNQSIVTPHIECVRPGLSRESETVKSATVTSLATNNSLRGTLILVLVLRFSLWETEQGRHLSNERQNGGKMTEFHSCKLVNVPPFTLFWTSVAAISRKV